MSDHKLGVKVTIPISENLRLTVRPEWSISNDYDFSMKFGFSKSGSTVEIGSVTFDPDFDKGLSGFVGSLYESYHAGLPSFKIDSEVSYNKGKATPFVVGGSFNLFDLGGAVRFGVGVKDYNVYYEYEFNISPEFSASRDYGAAFPYDGNQAIPGITEPSGRREDGDSAYTTRGIDPDTGQLVEVTTTVLSNNTIQGLRSDLLRGNTYPSDAVEVGYELNGLSQVAHEAYILGREVAKLNGVSVNELLSGYPVSTGLGVNIPPYLNPDIVGAPQFMAGPPLGLSVQEVAFVERIAAFQTAFSAAYGDEDARGIANPGAVVDAFEIGVLRSGLIVSVASGPLFEVFPRR
ncbi:MULTISPECIES: hypothetical protein [Roseobacteraceae]|uniref:hypothetical protein n=1 Tax=Roseobacteraceae TaxID=2854170 RepID=UPI003296983B